MDREEALKIVRDLYEKSLFLKKDKEAVATLIPELKESEDERIRKWILDGLDFYADAIGAPEDHKKAIAYLERQKEQKPIEDVIKNITKDKETATKFLKSAGIMDDNGELAEMYRSEQKPIISAEESLGISQEEYNKIVDECIYDEHKEQKPIFRVGDTIIAKDGTCIPMEPFHIEKIEDDTYWDGDNSILVCNQSDFQLIEQKSAEWSEEDENCRHDILLTLEALCSSASSTDTYIVYKHLIDWLKFLPERFNLQPKQEWSEEDEKKRNGLIKGLEDRMGFGWVSDPFSREEYIAWLKSLRPQPKAELTLLDENIIKAAVAFVEQNDHFNCWGGIDKHTVIKALRSLKPHWKPSKEQIDALERCVDYLDESDNEDAGMIGSLCHDLKLL